jgi:rubrerythrin
MSPKSSAPFSFDLGKADKDAAVQKCRQKRVWVDKKNCIPGKLYWQGMCSLDMKKIVYTICRQCGRDFPGNPSMRRCPTCRKKEALYRAQREKMKRSLPYYLKTDI